MFHFDRKLQQQESDTSSASDSTTDATARIGVITPTEDKEDAEAREAYESLMRHRKIRLRKKFKMGEAIKENKTFIVPDEVYKYPYELKSLKYLKVRHVTIENY